MKFKDIFHHLMTSSLAVYLIPTGKFCGFRHTALETDTSVDIYALIYLFRKFTDLVMNQVENKRNELIPDPNMSAHNNHNCLADLGGG